MSRRVAVLIVNYNMPERTDALCEYVIDKVENPLDLIVIDNGSDLQPPSKYTALTLKENVQTTGGWLMGLHYADALANKRNEPYFAYWFMITSTSIPAGQGDILTPMVDWLIDNHDAVGIHPALTDASTTSWEQLYARGGDQPRRTWMIDNIASLYRADWFDSIGRFDKRMIYAWGIDLETCYLARYQRKSLWVDERSRVEKITDIGYSMNRMNMDAGDRSRRAGENMRSILFQKYGDDYWRRMVHAEVRDEWR